LLVATEVKISFALRRTASSLYYAARLAQRAGVGSQEINIGVSNRRPGLLAIRATPWRDQEDVDRPAGIVPMEPYAPVADPESPLVLMAPERPNIALRKGSDGCDQAVTVGA